MLLNTVFCHVVVVTLYALAVPLTVTAVSLALVGITNLRTRERADALTDDDSPDAMNRNVVRFALSCSSPVVHWRHDGTTSMSLKSLIVLCHFCELHGPRWLFCTQLISQDIAAEQQGRLSDDVLSPSKAFPTWRSGSPTSFATVDTTDSEQRLLTSTNGDERKCTACFRPRYDIVSQSDDELLLSSPNLVSDVNQIVRTACLRSLSSTNSYL